MISNDMSVFDMQLSSLQIEQLRQCRLQADSNRDMKLISYPVWNLII